MQGVRWIVVTLMACLLVSCESGSSNTSPQAAVSQDDKPFAVITFPRELVAPFEPDFDAPASYVDSDTNGLTPKEIEEAGEFNIDEFEAAYELVETENPDLSIHSDEFALKIIDVLELGAANRAYFRLDQIANTFMVDEIIEGLQRDWRRLTPPERILIANNIGKGILTVRTVSQAREASRELFGISQGLEDGRGDAFRHSYWNWLMGNCCGVSWAEAFGTAHESGQSPTSYKVLMDLNNNQVGRNVFAAAPLAFKATARQTLLEHDLEFIDHTLLPPGEVINLDAARLVYVVPQQSMTIYDDGPEFDDVFDLVGGTSDWGATPRGSAKTISITRVSNGEYPVSIKCASDGTGYGCGFQLNSVGAIKLANGERSSTGQILIEESEVYTEMITFPTMDVEKEFY